MLVQNQTTFSASHVQAYKNEVSEHKATPEAVAEESQEKSSTCRLLKNNKNGSQSALTGGRHRTESIPFSLLISLVLCFSL